MNAGGVTHVFVINHTEGAGTDVEDIDFSDAYRETIATIPPPIVLNDGEIAGAILGFTQYIF